MKLFAERSPVAIGAVGITLTCGIIIAAFNYTKLPFFDHWNTYTAYFAEAGGLTAHSDVEVSGFAAGKVDSISLDGDRVLVTFRVDNKIQLRDRSEAAIQTKSLLGAKVLEVTSRGAGSLTKAIPLDRTVSPYQLPDALGDVSSAISGLDTDQLSRSLTVLSETFKDTPLALKTALKGVGRFSDSLGRRDERLRSLLSNANKSTSILAERSDQLVTLVQSTNTLLVDLESESQAVDELAGNLSNVAQQLEGFIDENRHTLKPALDKLNDVLTVLDSHKQDLQKALKGLNKYALGLGESVGSGPFFKAYVANLLPGQFVQPFVDAAFSDLGLDPNVLLPSHRTDPQTGQPATPPLPLPYPRTGQGGAPRLTLPDAITGKPGDTRYPYREPLPAPPAGGPPPGPPALPLPGMQPTEAPDSGVVEWPPMDKGSER